MPLPARTSSHSTPPSSQYKYMAVPLVHHQPNISIYQPQPRSRSRSSLRKTMASSSHSSFASLALPVLAILCCLGPRPAAPALVQQQPLVLKYHNGPLLKGNVTLNLLWYGAFSPAQRAVVLDFLHSLSAAPAGSRPPSVSSWWSTTARYKGGPSNLAVGTQILDERYSLGKSLKTGQLAALASKAGYKSIKARALAINLVLTSADVAVDGFCMSRCGTHGSGAAGKSRYTYAWVGNAVSQCPGQCAWPFHQPQYGPQTPPLVAPSGDVGVDGMVINLATVLAGAVTNPFNDGYYQGDAAAPLEAVSACTGIFGKGAYPGYPGQLLADKTTGASYNVIGVNGRKFLVPAMWDPNTSACETPV